MEGSGWEGDLGPRCYDLAPHVKGLGFYSDGSEEAVRGFKDVGWSKIDCGLE